MSFLNKPIIAHELICISTGQSLGPASDEMIEKYKAKGNQPIDYQLHGHSIKVKVVKNAPMR